MKFNWKSFFLRNKLIESLPISTARLLILLIFCLMIAPFVYLQFKSPYLFVTHDGEYHIERTFNYVTSWKEGVLFPSWARYYNQGFGSPIFIFLFPSVYWITSIFNMSGLSLVATLKLTFILFQLVGLGTMYLWLSKGIGFSKVASLLGSMAYIYAPYSLVQVFVRGTLREFASEAIFPLVLYMLTTLNRKQTLKQTGVAALIFGLFFLTDGISLVIFSPLILVYWIYELTTSNNKKRYWKFSFLAGLIGLMIASFIYLPFALESHYLRPSTVDLYEHHFVYFKQFFDLHWGFGFSMDGSSDSMSFQLGYVSVLAIIVLIYLKFRRHSQFDKLTHILLIAYLAHVLLMWHNPITLQLWKFLPFLQEVQLPWRFLAPTVFMGAYFVATIISTLKIKLVWFPIIFMLIILVSIKYLRTNQVLVYDETKLVNNSDDATAYHEFIPVWRVNTSRFDGFKPVETVSKSISIQTGTIKSQQLSFTTTASESGIVRVNTLYFPGWTAYLDNAQIPIEISKQVKNDSRDTTGLMSLYIPSGNHQILVKMQDTPLRILGKFLSLIGVLFSGILIVGKANEVKKKDKRYT